MIVVVQVCEILLAMAVLAIVGLALVWPAQSFRAQEQEQEPEIASDMPVCPLWHFTQYFLLYYWDSIWIASYARVYCVI